MSDKMKKSEKQRREAPPVENPHDRRSRERARGEDPFPRAPKAPDGISGNWK